MNPNEIRKLLDHHRRIVRELEEELLLAEQDESTSWVPQKFYTAYYILAGTLIGMGAAWVTLLLNMLGSLILHGDAMKLLRIYGTIFAGEEALESNQAAVLMLAVGIHTATGAICGAPIHVVVSKYFPDIKLAGRLLAGLALGLVMWGVNFYGILSWLQPLLVGKSIILEQVPIWVALTNHIAFTLLMLLLQPLGAFRREPGLLHAASG